MSILNANLWNTIVPGGISGDAGGLTLDTMQVIDELLWSLHAGSRDDLVFWTETDLIQWIDSSLKRLARKACVFVGRSAETVTVASQAEYDLPDRHISTLHVSHDTTPMRPAATIELEARDSAYLTTEGEPAYWYQDLLGNVTFGVAPVPAASDDLLAVIYEGYPETVTAGNTLVAAPAPLKGYLAMCVLAEAYGRESEIETPELAQHCRGRMELYESLFRAYYGSGV
jgi:hypothetical protein